LFQHSFCPPNQFDIIKMVETSKYKITGRECVLHYANLRKLRQVELLRGNQGKSKERLPHGRIISKY